MQNVDQCTSKSTWLQMSDNDLSYVKHYHQGMKQTYGFLYAYSIQIPHLTDCEYFLHIFILI
jgi:hypothetical protein